MGAAPAPIRPSRLTREDRREQLLDAAADVVVERGIGALTMEGLAERAGVSKALPYQHFDNANAVLLALYRREIDTMGQRVLAAVEGVREPDERVRLAVHAYFDIVVERGRVLGVFVGSGAGSAIAAAADGDARVGVEFIAETLVRPFGISGRRARMLASMFVGMLSGALESWGHGDGGRENIERTYVALVLGGIKTAARNWDAMPPATSRT